MNGPATPLTGVNLENRSASGLLTGFADGTGLHCLTLGKLNQIMTVYLIEEVRLAVPRLGGIVADDGHRRDININPARATTTDWVLRVDPSDSH